MNEYFVELCGLLFAGSGKPTEGLTYSRLEGWDGRPAVRSKTDVIPGWHGSYAHVAPLVSSPLMELTAAIIAETREEFFRVKRRVESMPHVGLLRASRGDGVWSSQVEIQQIRIPDWNGRTKTTFTIDLIAPDPVRYRDPVVLGPIGLPVQSGGLVLPAAFPWNFGTSVRPAVTLVNDGALPCWPVVRVSGSADHLTVTGGARRVQVGPFDGVLVLDSRERRAWLNGGEVTRELLRRDWHEVAPGESARFSFDAVEPSPDLSLTVEYQIGAW